MRRFLMLMFATIAVSTMALTTISWALKPEGVGPANAPAPEDHKDAVVQVYGADVWGVRGRFAIHTWIVTKAANALQLVDAIHEAALSYPYASEYVMYPGPNSNSFTAWVALEVPELDLDLPTKAIGKSWMIDTYPRLKDL